jgi:hypothetical protein
VHWSGYDTTALNIEVDPLLSVNSSSWIDVCTTACASRGGPGGAGSTGWPVRKRRPSQAPTCRDGVCMDEPDRLAFLRRDADRKRDAYKEKRQLEAESLRRAALLPNLQGHTVRRATSGIPGDTRMASSHHGETRCIASTLRRGDCLQPPALVNSSVDSLQSGPSLVFSSHLVQVRHRNL